ncbi:MAG TPA: DEAD/DEAH box helicase [Candidatus Nanoarchaeia archaeon]|nr:DEAD/DEAH box helicase [Candidatus Nanoarchaeia archaeon]
MKEFKEFKFCSQLHSAIERLGFSEPTEIQAKSIPLVLEGKDILGESATGSGKTLAFGCGIIQKVEPKKGLQALILTPTRELAEQVRTVISKLGHGSNLHILSIYGGVSINPQIDKLRTADIVISTPGRLMDHLERGTVSLANVKILVLDEADRMLDMGFIEDIERIIRACPRNRQNLFFSATILPGIERLARNYMNSPTKVFTTNQVDPSKLSQFYYEVPRNMKISLLIHLLKHETSNLVMVFCNTRRSTDLVINNLKANGVSANAIHGGFSQNQRSKAMDQIKSGHTKVLVCTDVAARGIDITNVSHIYNYEIPKDPVDYVHRIGRTARAGAEGKVINLLCDFDYDNFSRVLSDYRFEPQRMEVPAIERVAVRLQERSRRGPQGQGRGFQGQGRGYQGRPGHHGPQRNFHGRR